MTDDLTPAEVAAATGKNKAAQQAAVLARSGVPFVNVGHAVRVARVVARAHSLVKAATLQRTIYLAPS